MLGLPFIYTGDNRAWWRFAEQIATVVCVGPRFIGMRARYLQWCAIASVFFGLPWLSDGPDMDTDTWYENDDVPDMLSVQ